jgi:hypothetical protein
MLDQVRRNVRVAKGWREGLEYRNVKFFVYPTRANRVTHLFQLLLLLLVP